MAFELVLDVQLRLKEIKNILLGKNQERCGRCEAWMWQSEKRYLAKCFPRFIDTVVDLVPSSTLLNKMTTINKKQIITGLKV